MRDVQVHNEQLSETITREYYRVYPYLCAAIRNYVKDQVDNSIGDKDLYLSLIDVDIVHKVKFTQILFAYFFLIHYLFL